MRQPTEREVLRSLSSQIDALIERHLKKHSPWRPSQFFLPREQKQTPQERIEALTNIAGSLSGINPVLVVNMVLNLETESGLPWFHLQLAKHLGSHEALERWAGIWTGEEDRHAQALHLLLFLSGLVDMTAVEDIRHSYVQAGFKPPWTSAYHLLAYTVLQEAATAKAYAKLLEALKGSVIPSLVVSAILADEAKHESIYRSEYDLILKEDTDQALVAFWHSTKTFAMPGASMPYFKEMSYVSARSGIFGPFEYASVLERAIVLLGIEGFKPKTDSGKAAQELILKRPERVRETIGRRTMEAPCQEIKLPFLSERIVI